MSKPLDYTLIKKPHTAESFTEQHIREFMACADPDSGPEYFMSNFFYIQHPVRGRMLYQPYGYQTRLINTYHNFRFSISLMPRQTGKALDITTPILTPTGFKELKDINKGDVIYGPDGKPTQVTFATEVMYNRRCYKIEFDNRDSLIADEDHLWTVSSSNWRVKSKTLTTKELIPFIANSNKPYITLSGPIQNEEKNLGVDPYLLGVWLGDGGTRDAQVTCHIDDLQTYIDNGIVEKICDYSLKFPNLRHFRICGGTRTLKENNLYGNKHIPMDYLLASYDQRLSLLQGLMDTDGSIDKRSGRAEFYQKKESLIDQVRILLSTFGIKSRKSVKVINGESYYIIGFKTDLPIFRLKRKLEHISSHKVPKNKRTYIYSITPIETVPVKCIQVDNPEHLFLAGTSLIPTHNTTSAAGYLLWYAMFIPDSTVLVAAHKYTGAQEIMQRVRYAYESVPDHIRAGVTSYNKGSLEFDNGSRIVAQTTTETTGRGMSISLLYADEFAYVRPTIAKEFWTSISPTLSTGGKAIITSTPNSDEDKFAELWKGANKCIDSYGNPTELGINGFRAYQAHWNEHPDRDETWAAEQRAQLGDDRFRREIGCEFLIFDETLVSASCLIDLEGIEPLSRQGQIRWYKQPRRGATYVIALDPSLGTGGDPAAIQVLELPACEQVAEWQHNKTAVPGQISILKDICNYIYEVIGTENDIYYSVENNTIGEAALICINELGEENIRGQFMTEPSKMGSGRRYRRGFTTTNKSKLAACAKLKTMIETKKLIINSRNLITELKNFVASGGSFAAKIGETDDLVLGMLLAVRMTQVLQSFDSDIDNRLRDTFDEIIAPMPFIMTS